MVPTFARAAVPVSLALLVFANAAGAQTAKPSPTPAPTPVAFSAHAHASASMVAQTGTMSGTVQLAVAQRANLTRVDVLSVKSDTLPLPPLTATVVIDRSANTITAWSDSTKLYHIQPFLPRPAASATPKPNVTPKASASPRPPQRGTSPLSNLEVFEMTLKLIGHTTTLGLPTTGMAFDLQVQRKGQKERSHVTATTQLADEFAMFPMTLDLSVEPGAAPFSAKISYAVDDLTRETPAPARFDVPAGYTETSSLLGVIFPGGRPGAMPVPTKVP